MRASWYMLSFLGTSLKFCSQSSSPYLTPSTTRWFFSDQNHCPGKILWCFRLHSGSTIWVSCFLSQSAFCKMKIYSGQQRETLSQFTIPENFYHLVIISENYRTEETYEDQLVMKLILVSRSKQSDSAKLHELNLTTNLIKLKIH